MMTNFHRSRLFQCAAFGLVASAVSGCVVSKARYDEVRSQHQVEAEARADAQRQLATLQDQHKDALARLGMVESQLQASEAKLQDSRQDLDARAQALAEVEHEHEVTQRKHEDAEARVDQLREELARVATHLGTFAEERNRIAGERDQLSEQIDALSVRMAELEAKVIGSKVRSLLVRDISVALHAPLSKQVVRLGVTSDAVVLTTRADSLFVANKTSLTASGKKLITEIGEILQGRSEALELEELPAGRNSSGRVERLGAVAKQLAAAGVAAERVVFDARSAERDKAPSQTSDATERHLRIWIRNADKTPARAQSGHTAIEAAADDEAT